jgi:hypothetical protein
MNLLRFFRKPKPEPTPVVDGPFRIYVRRTPVGVEVDVSHFVEHLIRQLAQDFADATSEVGDDLLEIAKLDDSAAYERGRGLDDSRSEHQRDAAVERLLESIGGGSLILHGRQVREVAAALMAAGQVVAVPGQARGEAA